MVAIKLLNRGSSVMIDTSRWMQHHTHRETFCLPQSMHVARQCMRLSMLVMVMVQAQRSKGQATQLP